MKVLKLLLPMLVVLATLVVVAFPAAAATPTPQVVEEGPLVPYSQENKWPMVATGNGRVHVAWTNPQNAVYVNREEEAGTFDLGLVGVVARQSVYFTASVAVGTDGTVHYVWTPDGRMVVHRSKAVGQNWSPEHLVASGQDFANGLDVAVKGRNEVFVSWRTGPGAAIYAHSPNSGLNWSTGVVTNSSFRWKARLAAGPNGNVFITWSDRGTINVGQWNGSGFASGCVTCGKYGSSTGFYDPSVSVAPDGRPYVAFRNVNDAIFYGFRQIDGTWVFSRQFDAPKSASAPVIEVDSQNNIHLAWSNGTSIHYAVQKAGDVFSSPVTVRTSSNLETNLDMATSVKPGYTLAHVAWESFSGTTNTIRYARARTVGIGCVAGVTPSITAVQPQLVGPYKQYLPLILNQKDPGC